MSGKSQCSHQYRSLSTSLIDPRFFLLSREMARAVGNKRTAVQKKSNAIGFSRRQARKNARQSTSVDDVYEFQPEKVRRSKVALRLTKEELAELGRNNASDSEGDDHQGGQPQPRLIGQNSDDERVDSEDDEDIDSDAAFGESDEETFAGYGFTHKVRLSPRWRIQTHLTIRTPGSTVEKVYIETLGYKNCPPRSKSRRG